jgi:hypothetical protein
MFEKRVARETFVHRELFIMLLKLVRVILIKVAVFWLLVMLPVVEEALLIREPLQTLRTPFVERSLV